MVETIQVGDVVIVHDDTPKNKWRLAIVRELQRGQNGLSDKPTFAKPLLVLLTDR